MATLELAQMKQGARATWASGDYGSSGAVELWPVGERIVAHLDIQPGERVLDVAVGTGNAAIRAARAGAEVVGVDLTPELFERGRRNAAEAGVEIEWVEGDAEALPFEDESFDVVMSVFGCMFAPRHQVTADELVRVLRPRGRLGVTGWTPEGRIGRFFVEIGKRMPPGPDFASPPVLWGAEDHVSGLFEGSRVALEFLRETVGRQLRFDSPDEGIEFFSTKFGPFIMMRAAAEADGSWPALREELRKDFESDEAAEYLVTLGRKAV